MMIRRWLCAAAALLLTGCAGISPVESPPPDAAALPQSQKIIWDPAGRFFIAPRDPDARLEVNGDGWRYIEGGKTLLIFLRPLRRPMHYEGYRESWKKTAPDLLAGDFPGVAIQAITEIDENKHRGLALQFASAGSAVLIPSGRALLKLISQETSADFAFLKGFLATFYLVPEGLLLSEDAPAQPGIRWAQAYAEARLASARNDFAGAINLLSVARGGSQAGPLLEYEYARDLILAGRPPKEALPLMEAVARARPQAVDIRYNLALLRGRSGDIPGAIQDAQEYLKAQPEDVMALNSLARAYAAAGDRKQALLMFEKAKAIAPNYALTYYHAGKFWLEPNPKEAAVQFRQFLELEPGSEIAQEVRAWLEGR